MPCPESVPTLTVTGLSITPATNGTLNVTVSVVPGTIVFSGGPVAFNVPALLKLLQDLAAAAPTLIADFMAIFAAQSASDSSVPVKP